jgi:hypothetical protein
MSDRLNVTVDYDNLRALKNAATFAIGAIDALLDDKMSVETASEWLEKVRAELRAAKEAAIATDIRVAKRDARAA